MIEKQLIPVTQIQSRIHTIRGIQVMLDSDLALLYGIEIRTLNQAVRRNSDRFPPQFMFQLTPEEYECLRSQIVILNKVDSLRSQIATLKAGRGAHRKYLPYAFTEQGVAMLSAVLRSETTVKTSIQIINAFVAILTRDVNKQLALDIKKFNEQYQPVEVKEFKNAHDWFIIIDGSAVYHFGASLKDLGKKWFAFSKMDIGAAEMLRKLDTIV